MGIEALYRRRNTSRCHPGLRIYPYLLGELAITRPNHVWAMNVTYLPMKQSFSLLGHGAELGYPTGPVLANLQQPHGGFSASRHWMDGKGCWRDNVFVERQWRTIKYEEVCLKACDSVSTAKAILVRYIRLLQQRAPAPPSS